MSTMLRSILAGLLMLAIGLGTALGDPGESNGKGGWINMPGGRGGNSSGHGGGNYRVIAPVEDLDDGVLMKLQRSMRGAVCLLDFGGGATALLASHEGFVRLPGVGLRILKDLGYATFKITIVAADEEVLFGSIQFSLHSDELVVRIQ